MVNEVMLCDPEFHIMCLIMYRYYIKVINYLFEDFLLCLMAFDLKI
ncbi:hypothetical protein II654_02120 [bacterium]|nr:hypothetical protein [bacterium]